MPYIHPDYRKPIDHAINELVFTLKDSMLGGPGVLNYALTQVILGWLPEDRHYSDYNSAIGVLGCIKQEIYRRAIAPYEDKAKEKNGDLEW